MAMFPLRVVIETVREGECTRCADGGPLMADSYAIVSGQTPLSQLVDTVLAALGLQQLALGAKGMIQLNSWKALPFDAITDDNEATVEQLLKDVSNHLTLKILTKQTDTAVQDCVSDMKERLMKAAIKRSPDILSTIKNHQLKDFVSQLLLENPPVAVSAEQMHGFNHWLDELNVGGGGSAPSPASVSGATTNGSRSPNGGLTAGRFFNSALEKPKLERWFNENPNPTRQKLLQYMTLLNAGNYRRHHSKITYQQICNWFSNARAAARYSASAALAEATSTNGSTNGGFDINELLRRRQQMAAAAAAAMAAAMNGIITSTAANTVAQQPLLTSLAANGTTDPSGLSLPPFDEQALPIDSTAAQPENGDDHSSPVDCSMTSVEVAKSEEPTSNDRPVTLEEEDDDDGSNSKSSPASSYNNEMTIGGSGAPLNIDTSTAATTTFSSPSAAAAAVISSLISSAHHNGNSLGISAFSPKVSEGQTTTMNGSGLSTTPTNNNSSTAANNNVSGMMSRSRLMFDPLTELPLLEKWFEENPHPSWIQIDQYTETLNSLGYRQTYPPISTHNVKIWFKNRRAKCKRMLGAAVDKFNSVKAEVR